MKNVKSFCIKFQTFYNFESFQIMLKESFQIMLNESFQIMLSENFQVMLNKSHTKVLENVGKMWHLKFKLYVIIELSSSFEI